MDNPQNPIQVPSAGIVKADVSSFPELDLGQSIPTITPWLRYGAVLIAISSGLCIAVMGFVPYKVIVKAQGSIRPQGEEILVNSPLDGRVTEVLVEPNQTVASGSPLVVLDRVSLRSELEENRLSASALADQLKSLDHQLRVDRRRSLLEVKKAESELRFTAAEARRYQSLTQQGAASASLYQEKRSAYEQAEARVQQARQDGAISQADLLQRRAQLLKEQAGLQQRSDSLNRDLGQVVIRAPMNATVDELLVRSLGQTVARGEEVARLIPQAGQLFAQVKASVEDIDVVRAGQEASIRVSACPYTDFGVLSATVKSIAPDRSEAGDEFSVMLQPRQSTMVSNTGKICRLKVGMSVSSDIVTRQETVLVYLLRKMRFAVGL